MSSLNSFYTPIVKGRDDANQPKFNIWTILFVTVTIIFIGLLIYLLIRQSQRKKRIGSGSLGGSTPLGCNNTNECDTKSVCENGVCRKLPGESCDGGNQCTQGNDCIGNKCIPISQGELGEECNNLELQCMDNLLCVNNVCKSQVGGRCTTDNNCERPSTGCVDNTCVSANPGMLTGTCKTGDVCNQGLVCQMRMLGKSCRLESGQVCKDSSECQSMNCMRGVCT